MNYLLDTHTFLWAAFSPDKLSIKARIEISSAENQVCISCVSFWEISLKYILGEIELTNCSARRTGNSLVLPTPQSCTQESV